MIVAAYVRVSTEEQARKGYSLKDQLRECRKIAERVLCEDGIIVEYIDEGISGEFLDRPALSRLRLDVKEERVAKVICLDPDRLSRKLMNQLIITEEIEKRAELIFVNGEYQNTPEGNLFYQMRGAISEFEKAKINERMSRGRKEKARQGKVVRDYRVYGYDYNKEIQKFVINKYEAEVVKLIFKLFTGQEKEKSVEGINGIAKYLTERGIPTKLTVGMWHRQVVRQILMNKAYIGEFYQNRWNTEGMLVNRFRKKEDRIQASKRPKEEWILVPCQPIVKEEIFLYAQSLLEESRRRWAKKSKNEYLLSGILRCGTCDNTMVGRRSKNWGKYILEYTDMKNTAGAKNKGCGRRIKTEEIDNIVWNVIVEWLNKQKVNENTGTTEDNIETFEEAQLLRLDKRVEEIKKARQNLINFLAGGEGLDEKSSEDIRGKLQQLKNEQEASTTEREKIVPKIEGLEQDKYKRNLLEEASEYYLFKSPQEITYNDKKELIRLLVREVKVFDNEIKIFGF